MFTLLIVSLAFATSCKKDTLEKIDSDPVVVDNRSTIEFSGVAKHQDFQTIYTVNRDNVEIYSFSEGYFPADKVVSKTAKVELQSGDNVFCFIMTDGGGSIVETSIKINGKLMKTQTKACTYGGCIYEVP